MVLLNFFLIVLGFVASLIASIGLDISCSVALPYPPISVNVLANFRSAGFFSNIAFVFCLTNDVRSELFNPLPSKTPIIKT